MPTFGKLMLMQNLEVKLRVCQMPLASPNAEIKQIHHVLALLSLK